MTQHFLHRRDVSSRRDGEGGCCMAAAVIGEVLFYPCLVLDAPDILGYVVRFLDEVVHEGIGVAFVTWRKQRLGKVVEGDGCNEVAAQRLVEDGFHRFLKQQESVVSQFAAICLSHHSSHVGLTVSFF